MPTLTRDQLIRSEKTLEIEQEREYNNEDESSIVKNIFEIKDLVSYEILKQELINNLERDNYPELINPNSNNVVRILSENIDNLKIEDVEDKIQLDLLRTEIRNIVLEYLEVTYDLKYIINENEAFIDLEPIADLYEFFIIRKLTNINKYYHAIINMSFFDNLPDGSEKDDLNKNLKEYLIGLVDEGEEINTEDNNTLTLEILSKFFTNKDKIIHNGIYNIEGFSSFMNFIIEDSVGETVTENIKNMFWNFGSYEGIEFDDETTFKSYFDCLNELDNSNQLIVNLSSRVFEKQGM